MVSAMSHSLPTGRPAVAARGHALCTGSGPFERERQGASERRAVVGAGFESASPASALALTAKAATARTPSRISRTGASARAQDGCDATSPALQPGAARDEACASRGREKRAPALLHRERRDCSCVFDKRAFALVAQGALHFDPLQLHILLRRQAEGLSIGVVRGSARLLRRLALVLGELDLLLGLHPLLLQIGR